MAAGLDRLAGQIMADVAGQFAGILVTVFALLAQTLQHDRLDFVIDPVVVLCAKQPVQCPASPPARQPAQTGALRYRRTQPDRFRVQNPLDYVLHVAAHVIRKCPTQHLIQYDPQRIHIAANVDPARNACDLLGRCPRQRTDKLTGPRHRRDDRPTRCRRALLNLRQTEIENMRLGIGIDQDVARLQVPMNDAA